VGAADEGQGDKFRQFWHIPFWKCSVGICSDEKADDVGFLESVIQDLPKRLPMKPGRVRLFCDRWCFGVAACAGCVLGLRACGGEALALGGGGEQHPRMSQQVECLSLTNTLCP